MWGRAEACSGGASGDRAVSRRRRAALHASHPACPPPTHPGSLPAPRPHPPTLVERHLLLVAHSGGDHEWQAAGGGGWATPVVDQTGPHKARGRRLDANTLPRRLEGSPTGPHAPQDLPPSQPTQTRQARTCSGCRSRRPPPRGIAGGAGCPPPHSPPTPAPCPQACCSQAGAAQRSRLAVCSAAGERLALLWPSMPKPPPHAPGG